MFTVCLISKLRKQILLTREVNFSGIYVQHGCFYCSTEKLHSMLKEDGGIKALLGMVRSGNSDVVAQVARGMANFAKCESRAIIQGSSMSLYEVEILCRSSSLFIILMTFVAAGHRKGRSLLMEDGGLEWLIANCNTASASTRRHVELALCHLAQNGKQSSRVENSIHGNILILIYFTDFAMMLFLQKFWKLRPFFQELTR